MRPTSAVRRTTFHYEGVIRQLCRTPRAERARRDLINFAGENKEQFAITLRTHRTYVMFNHVRIIKQLFVTLDGNRRNLITHEEAVYRVRYTAIRDHAMRNTRFNREEIITELPSATVNLGQAFNTA